MNNRREGKPLSKSVIIGTGLVALDVVIADNVTADPLLCAGGTCGNVLTALAYMGWDAYPIARLRSDAASKRIIEDLKHWGVKLDFISLSDCGSTPVVVQHIRQNRAGERSHSFSRKCPACGAWLPWYKAVKAATVPELTPRLPKGDLFYFDRTSRGAITLAHNAKENGAIVMFEPSSESDPDLLSDALSAAHIVKVASDRVNGNEAFLEAKGPLLLIETLGAEGLRFTRSRKGGRRTWKNLPAFPVKELRDAAGSGDWCTAGIIDVLGHLGPDGLSSATDLDVQAALQRGQAIAAWNCRYDGARGGMYRSSRKGFQEAVADILNGKAQPHERETDRHPLKSAGAPVWCDCCLTGV